MKHLEYQPCSEGDAALLMTAIDEMHILKLGKHTVYCSNLGPVLVKTRIKTPFKGHHSVFFLIYPPERETPQ